MARYSDKEKEKDQQAQEGYGQGPDTGYGELPPEPEPEPTGSLKVKIVALGSPRKGMKLPRIDVTLRATSYGKEYEDTKTTGSNDEALWPDLPLDRYTLSVAAPPEYEQPEDLDVELTESHQDHEEEIGLTPRDATLYMLAFLDEKRCGDPAGQKCLEGIDFEIWSEGRFLKTVTTRPDGLAIAPVPPGNVVAKTRASRNARGKKWKPQAWSFQAFLEPGEEDTVNVPFVESLGTLLLSAVFVDETHGGREIPMSGVKALLYSGNTPKGVPFRQPVLADRAPRSEGELDEGFYTLVPVGPESFRGVPIEPDTVEPIFVEGGETKEVVFSFRQAKGCLTGFLLEQKSQEGFPGARLLLYPSDGSETLFAETGENGAFTFKEVPAGLHELVLEQDKLSKADNTEWALAPDSPRSRKVLVKAGATEILQPLYLVQDDHVLVVRVVGPDGKIASGVQVDVRDEQGTSVGTFPVDDQGEVTIHVPRIGNYSVSLATFDSGALKPAAKQVFVNHPALITLEMTGSSWSYPPGGGSPREAVVDIPYPLLGAGFSVPSAPAGGTGSAAGNLGLSVENTLREVLGGWKPRGLKTDPKGFLGALNQAFTLKEVEGHVEFSWTPRTYAVQPDMGGLTGAQASIFNRAKVALDQSVPLLDGLYPLRADSDEQDVDAIRAIVRSTFTELVNELGVEGGPRVPRVDSLFEQLLGVSPVFDPERVGGQLGMVAQQFGLQRRRINTIDEEQNLTNFIIVVEYVLSLKTSWDTQRGFFTRTGLSEPFFGTQLVLVSRSLAVVAESVQEVYAAMDSVFLGPAERQVVELTFPNEPGKPSLFVAELLSWVDQIATVEGPRLIQDGGKAGVVAFQPTLDRVARLAGQALIPPQDGAQLPAGYRTARVQRALQELADHLDETARLAGQIKIDKNAA